MSDHQETRLNQTATVLAALAASFALALMLGTSPSHAGSQKEAMTNYNGPADTPREWGSEFEKLRQPYVEEAKKTYPAAKSRFLAGLPSGYRFFVTVDFQQDNIHENAFLQVRKISGGRISATVATKLSRIKNPRYGEQITLSESRALDWTITSADGKEEGNYIGKFLDEYYKTHR